MRILAAQLNPIVGDIRGNTDKILKAIERGREGGVELVLFPELTITGYAPEDFLLLDHFLDDVEEALERIVEASHGITVVVGLPRRKKTFQNSSK